MEDIKSTGLSHRAGSILIELALGCYFLFAIVFAARLQVYASLPFLMMFCVGFFLCFGSLALPGNTRSEVE